MWILLLIFLENVCSSSISITGIQNSATGLRSTIGELGSVINADSNPVGTWYVVFELHSLTGRYEIRTNEQHRVGLLFI